MPRGRHNPEHHTPKTSKGVLTEEQRKERAPKRTDAQREIDKLQIIRLVKRGLNQTEIAEQIGVHQTQISYDMRIIYKELAEHRHKITEEVLAARELQYGELLRIYWDQWDKSIGKMGIGNIEYLRCIERVYKELNALQGLYPTREVSVKGTMTATQIGATVNWDVLSGITDGKVPDEVEEQIKKVIDALPDHTGQGRIKQVQVEEVDRQEG